ncbi:MAG: DUF2997 domain-containing protein [Candidatus Sericytochromatia bacterium]
MSQAEFQIRIDPTGEILIEVMGSQGPVCTDLTAFLEDALGTVQERRFKSEYYTGQIKSDNRIQNQQY